MAGIKKSGVPPNVFTPHSVNASGPRQQTAATAIVPGNRKSANTGGMSTNKKVDCDSTDVCRSQQKAYPMSDDCSFRTVAELEQSISSRFEIGYRVPQLEERSRRREYSVRPRKSSDLGFKNWNPDRSSMPCPCGTRRTIRRD